MRKIELQAIVEVEITDEQYQELLEIDGERATKFLSFGIDVEEYDIEVFAIYLDEDKKSHF